MAALEGVNIVEFSSHLGAAYAAMLLAEQGARVIKVEPPGGAPGRGAPHFHVVNRSKISLFVDFETSQSREQVRDLFAWADIVITGQTPARAHALGLDYDALRRVNPRALSVSMPPMGSCGPDSDLEAGDELVQARGGIAGNQWSRSGNPVVLAFPAPSYSAGVLAASAAVAALAARGDDREGQSIEVSLLAGALSLQTGSIILHEKLAALYTDGSNDPLGPIPSYRLFQAGDGRYLFVACGNATFWNKLALAIDRPELVADPRFEGAPWGNQAHWPALKEILEAVMRTRPRDDWLRLLRRGDVPCAPVLSRQEFIEDPQVRLLGMRREIADPTLGATIQMGVPIDLRDTPGEIAGPAPAVESRAREASELIAAMNQPKRIETREEPRMGSQGKGPLAGVVVLDFASYIAGSYGPMILAQMGADVIKIESLHGDAVRHLALGFLGWNQGKRGLALDLNTADGREIVHELVKKADIVVENLRPGRMRKLALDYETLAALNPRLIYMSVTAFGSRGPQHDQPGFDPLLQARSGVMAAQGGHHGHPVYLTSAICDYGAAMLSALGCVLALRARQITGRGQMCETSLLQSAMAFQAGEFLFCDGRPDMEDGDPEYRGSSALSRCYRCRDDGWLFVSIAEPAHWDAMRVMCANVANVTHARAVREPSESRLSASIAGYFAKLDRADALRTLDRAGIPATPVNRVKDLFADPQVTANELLASVNHSQWGRVIQTGLLAKFSACVPANPRAAPLLGEHTAEILSQYLGYGEARIADLRARGVIKSESRGLDSQ